MPANRIIQMGEKPNNQISNADIIGIQMVYLFIFAAFAKLNVGAAINATTAGRMPLKIASTVGFSLKRRKNNARHHIMRKEGRIAPNAVTIHPLTPRKR